MKERRKEGRKKGSQDKKKANEANEGSIGSIERKIQGRCKEVAKVKRR